MNNQKENKEVTIIGAGPAGITAAIQLKRSGLEPLLLERREVGGLLWNANLVENYPGFPNGVSGEKLIQLISAQANRLGVKLKREEVLAVESSGSGFFISTNSAERKTDYLIVASGTKSRPIPNVVDPAVRDRVFTEVWPLKTVKEKNIIVVGAGDAAFDYALNLSKNRNFVTILNRGDSVKCLGLLFDRVLAEKSIAYQTDVAMRKVKANNGTDRLEVHTEANGREEILDANYVLFAIGRESNLDFLSEEVRGRKNELVESGRLYFVGDVKNELYRQVAIAAGDGLRAAMQIYQRIYK